MIGRRQAMAGAVGAMLAAPEAVAAAAKANAADEALLARHTQSLMNAITRGDGASWERLLSNDFVITDENGTLRTKAELVGSMKPLGPRITGRIDVQDFAARISGDIAVVTYVSDEHETYFDQPMHCRYRSTDTWRRSAAGWRQVASQVLALRTDPPAIAVDPAIASALIGTYALAADKRMVVAGTTSELTLSDAGKPPKPLLAEAQDVFFVPGSPRYRYLVERDRSGQVAAIIQRREAWDLRWVRQP
jgi:hypothetical protein